MKTRILFCGWILLAGLSSKSLAQREVGEVIFQADFDAPDALNAWQTAPKEAVRIVPGRQGGHALEVEVPLNHAGPAFARMALPVEKFAGSLLKCEAMVNADGVGTPPQAWNGVKVMLHFGRPGGDLWLQRDNIYGTFDWKLLHRKVEVPADITSAELLLGLESVSGRAKFDDVKITLLRGPRVRPSTPPIGPVYTGHDAPRLRGVMVSTRIKEADLEVLGKEWGANHIRWQLTWDGFPHSPADNGDLASYDEWLAGALKHMDELLPLCEKFGIKVLIDLHTLPGGRSPQNECRLFQEKRFQDNFLGWWEKIAARYRGNKTIWGYDLANEPIEGDVAKDCMDWQELATAAARTVRKSDPDHAIIVEPAPGGGVDALANLEPLPVPGVVYSVHMYSPHQFTHQGVYGTPVGVRYPGIIAGNHWDKETLRHALQPALEWQQDHGVQLYIGEFSAIRWAPDESAYRYLKDCIDIFEDNRWDWAYHAFREWNGWSVEHGPDPSDSAPSKTQTSREKLLRSWFEKTKEGEKNGRAN